MSLVRNISDLHNRAKRDDNGCLIWQGAIKSNGYGNVVVEGKTWTAHRLSYTWAKGPVPRDARVLHSCDARACIEPSHLHVGSARLNSREMVLRGRYRGPAKLSPAQRACALVEVASGESQGVVAHRWGVSQATISNIVRGKHTALGDARWAMRLYDRIAGAAALEGGE